jgi:hypothetical protein
MLAAMKRNARVVTMLVGLLLSAVFAWLALANVRWADLRAAFALADLWLALPFVLAQIAFYGLKAERWRLLLAPTAALPTRSLVPSLIVGFASNNILPLHLGELVRVYLLGREHGLSRAAVLGTVVLERIFDFLALLVLALLAFALGDAEGEELRAAGLFLGAVTLLSLGPAALLVFRTELLIGLLRPLLRVLPAHVGERINQQLTALATGFGALRTSHQLPAILANSLVQWALFVGCVWLALEAFGIVVPWTVPVVVLVLIVAGITLPSGPGYIGTIEYCFVLGLKAYGVGAAAALSAGLFYHALTWGFLVVPGIFFLRRYGLTWRSLERAITQP